MELLNNLQAATFVPSFLITHGLMIESKAIYFYCVTYHTVIIIKVLRLLMIPLFAFYVLSPSLPLSLPISLSLTVFSSHQLILFWCIMLQPAPQMKSCLMILARTSFKSVCLFVWSAVTHHASQGGLPRGLRADLRHPPTTPFPQLPHGRPGLLR